VKAAYHRPLRRSLYSGNPLCIFDHSRFEPFTDQSNDPLIGDPVFEKPEHPRVIDFVEGHHDTLPIISTSPNASSSRVRITHSKGSLWRCLRQARMPSGIAVRSHSTRRK
jgi:hypothetical protein